MTDFRHNCLSHIHRTPSDDRCLIIGEVAQSHDGSLGAAHAFIDAIAKAGADAVKFQTHIAAEESTPSEPWRVRFSRQDGSRYEYWQRMEFTEEQWRGLKKHADEAGLLFLSTPFSKKAAEMLDRIGMKVWKMASGEVGNTPLLEFVSSFDGPVILSSGMSPWSELDTAVETVRRSGNPLAVLQCTSAYPCPPDQVGLNLLREMKDRYDLPVGLSDHSGNIYAGLAAVALGAEVVEVHVAFSREMFGPDVPASLTTGELGQLVEGARQIESMTASRVDKDEKAEELKDLRRLFTKSVVAGTDLSIGTVLEAKHLELKKPGNGLSASSLGDLVGRRLKRNIRKDEIILMDDVEETMQRANSDPIV
ncbi:MAG: N-acetylneuraminate synthase family protein [Acidobacteriota bacterium]|nr:MAG: N-acetylneuraminate synthase family protein [Acidobacteriota bacterium]